MDNLKRVREKIRGAPESSGVYLIKDKSGRVIYVGKAKSLKKRLGIIWAALWTPSG